jgi:hypothetical protein
MEVIDYERLRNCLSWAAAVDAVREALRGLGADQVTQPPALELLMPEKGELHVKAHRRHRPTRTNPRSGACSGRPAPEYQHLGARPTADRGPGSRTRYHRTHRSRGRRRVITADRDRDQQPRPAVRCPAAGVKARGATRVQNDRPVLVQREHPVVAAGDIDQVGCRAQAQAARINDPAIAAERPGQLPVGGKAQKRTVPVAVRATGAGHHDSAHALASSVQGPVKP